MAITAKSCAEFLREHNEWRRGGEGPMLEPKDIGENIDFAVDALEFLHNFLAFLTEITDAAKYMESTQQTNDLMRKKIELLEKELEAERALSFRNQVAELEKQRDELLAEFNAYKEGSEEAFGTVVAQKQAAEARLQTMQLTIASQQGVICDFRDQSNKLLAALRTLITQRIGAEQIRDGIQRAIASVKGNQA